MQIVLPKATIQPAYREIVPAGYAPAVLNDVGADEEEIRSESSPVMLNLENTVSFLYRENSAPKADRGLYFAGRKPTCDIIGLGRSNANRSDEVIFTSVEDIARVGGLVRESVQPYGLFVIDALSYDTFSAVHAIMQEISGKGEYYRCKPVVSVVEKDAKGLVFNLRGQFSGTPLRFTEARKYGKDLIDAQLFGQLRY